MLINGDYWPASEALRQAGFAQRDIYWEDQMAAGRKESFNGKAQPNLNARELWLNSSNGLIAELSQKIYISPAAYSVSGPEIGIMIHGALALNGRGQSNLYNYRVAERKTADMLRRTGRSAFDPVTASDVVRSPYAKFADSFDPDYDRWCGDQITIADVLNDEIYKKCGLGLPELLHGRGNRTASGGPALTFSVPVGAFCHPKTRERHGMDIDRFRLFLCRYGDLVKRSELQNPHVTAFLGHVPAGSAVSNTSDMEHQIIAERRYKSLSSEFKRELGPHPDLKASLKEFQIGIYDSLSSNLESRLQKTCG